MRIDKVNLNPTTGVTVVEFSTIENEGKDFLNHRLRSNDAPPAKLKKALWNLKPHVENIAEVPDGYLDDVRGLSLHRDGDNPDEWTVTFTATKKLDGCNSPLVLNTPNWPPDDDLRMMIVEVLEVTADFVERRRAQTEMFDKKKAQAGDKDVPDAEPPKKGKGRAAETKETPEPVKQEEKPKGKGKGKPAKPAYPKVPADDDSGQRYKRMTDQGFEAEVKQDSAGAWWGRVDKKPIAQRAKSSEAAMKLVDEHVGNTGEWKPTVELEDAGAQDGEPATTKAEDL